MKVVWRAAARADIVRIIHYIAGENPVAAWKIGSELVVAGDSLITFPQRGRPGRVLGTRELTTIAPFIIVYEIVDHECVRILRVWHGAQERS